LLLVCYWKEQDLRTGVGNEHLPFLQPKEYTTHHVCP